MALLIVLLILSIIITYLFFKWAFRTSAEIENKIGSKNYFLLSLAWWLWDDVKRKK